MPQLERRSWVPSQCDSFVQRVAQEAQEQDDERVAARIEMLAAQNRRIHEQECVNLNPATNTMNPRAEALLASGIGTRPSLGYPGDKYEMGLEAIEQIEILAAELAAEIFAARYAEIRVGSGAMANLYAFMATTRPGDRIIAPPASLGGHVTHHRQGAAGLYGLDVHEAPVSPTTGSVDLDELRALALRVRPALITVGGSLNLYPHPLRQIRTIADEVGARVLFDAAHVCGLIAGQAWPNPLREGAHLMSMSTYKSLGGPPGGLVVTDSAELAEKLESIAYPGLTANFDAAKSAALAMALLDWRSVGRRYAQAMVETAQALANALSALGAPVYRTPSGITNSHQFALVADRYGGGQTAARKLRLANILTSGIGLPVARTTDDMNGLRIGTPEIVRWGMTPQDMSELARLIMRALEADDAGRMAADVTQWRARFNRLSYIR